MSEAWPAPYMPACTHVPRMVWEAGCPAVACPLCGWRTVKLPRTMGHLRGDGRDSQ